MKIESKKDVVGVDSAGWESPETAPQDGSQILGDFGYPWPQVAAWNTHDEKWATVNMMAHEYCGKIDIWFETELEAEKQLKHWMPLPSLPNVKGDSQSPAKNL
jgi:hypothetical protein